MHFKLFCFCFEVIQNDLRFPIIVHFLSDASHLTLAPSQDQTCPAPKPTFKNENICFKIQSCRQYFYAN